MKDSRDPKLPPDYTAPDVQGTRSDSLFTSSCRPTGSAPVERCHPGSDPNAECVVGHDPKIEKD